MGFFDKVFGNDDIDAHDIAHASDEILKQLYTDIYTDCAAMANHIRKTMNDDKFPVKDNVDFHVEFIRNLLNNYAAVNDKVSKLKSQVERKY